MAIIQVTETTAGKALGDYFMALAGSMYMAYSPYIFVDSATPMTIILNTNMIPTSTAVTVGQKFSVSSNSWGYCLECIVAGTTSSSPTTDITNTMLNDTWAQGYYYFGRTFVSGTATFAIRMYHGWSTAIARTLTPLNTATPFSYLVANTHAGTTGSFKGSAISSVISVQKAAGQWPGYLAGASETSTTVVVGTSNISLVRGITCTNTTINSYLQASGRLLDCALNFKREASLSNAALTRCTLTNAAAEVAFSSVGGGSLSMEAGTTPTTGTPSVVFGSSYATNYIGAIDTSAIAAQLASAPMTYGVKMNGVPTDSAVVQATSAVFGAGATVRSNKSTPAVVAADTVPGTSGTTTATVYQTGSSFSVTTLLGHKLLYPLQLAFYNTRITEGFVINVEALYADLTSIGLADLSIGDMWVEAVYLQDATTFAGKFVASVDRYDRRDLVHTGPTPEYLAASPTTWVAGFTQRKKRLSVVVNPRREGLIHIRVGCWMSPWTRTRASVSTIQVYIDPKITLSEAP